MKTQTKTTQLTILGLMTAVLLLMAYTPLGYLNIGPLAITFNVIPVAICAITLGPAGGAAAGAVFGLTSFLQCIGVGGTTEALSLLAQQHGSQVTMTDTNLTVVGYRTRDTESLQTDADSFEIGRAHV